ncbi:hypothetical protein N9A86_02690 [Akkermansiaceae bacterium]|nr:hypothetical protein [Akkermansiaceae bacterium]MDB4544612.1 hypothetical protein [Akkermansiaceae bacterium]
MSESNEIQNEGLADEIRNKAALVAKSANLEMPEENEKIPTVRVDQPVSHAAREIGMILAPSPLFRFGESYVTIGRERGDLEPMTSDRFRSWCESYLYATRPKGEGQIAATMTRDFAGMILASDRFKEQIREIKAINTVRLPAWRGSSEVKVSRSGPFWLKEGSDLHIELLPPGYDERTKTFTLELVKYRHDLPLLDAAKFFSEVLSRFPWAMEEETTNTRSLGVHFSAMIGVYCASLFTEGTVKPMIVYNGNQPGSGKSLLMRMALAPVHGEPAESTKPNNEELRKILDIAALNRKPYLVLDDVAFLNSNELNRFTNSPVHEPRILGQSRTETRYNVTQVLVTGNQLSLAEDLVRRSLVVDLFEAGKATERTFEKELTPDWLCLSENRAKFLAALWAIVREWNKNGRPACKEARHTSASQWASVIGAIVHHLNPKLKPFAKRTFSLGGDESGAALEALVCGLASGLPKEGREFRTADLIEEAEALNLLEAIAGHAKDPRKTIGHKVAKLRGRVFTDSQGRRFEFGKLNKSFGAVYPIRFLKP